MQEYKNNKHKCMNRLMHKMNNSIAEIKFMIRSSNYSVENRLILQNGISVALIIMLSAANWMLIASNRSGGFFLFELLIPGLFE